jgi:toxin ParE1/3/4
VRIAWTERALAELEAIEDYFGQYNLRSAVAAGDRILEQVDLLVKFPMMGREGRVPETQEIVVPKSGCVVVYQRELDEVRILRVIHGGQEWPDEL